MARAAVVAALLFSISFAGCAGGEAASKQTATTQPEAPAPVVDAETGSVTGTVADEELTPLAGATVGILELGLQTTTDAAGEFTFNEVAPGSYGVIASRLGFIDATKKVTVVAGEIVKVGLTLRPLQIAEEPYMLSIPRVGNILFGNAWTGLVTQVGNSTHEMVCTGCQTVVHFDPKPSAIMSEAMWPCNCQPYVNQDVWVKYLKDWGTGQLDGTVVINTYLSNREQFVWEKTLQNEEPSKSLAKAKNNAVLFLLHAGTYVNFQNKVDSWHTFLYNAEEFPENYTALPPV